MDKKKRITKREGGRDLWVLFHVTYYYRTLLSISEYDDIPQGIFYVPLF